MKITKNCPDCREPVASDAGTCAACGWIDPYARRRSSPQDAQPRHQGTCTWRSGSLRCAYPVGLFSEGATRGWCVFHRHTVEGVAAARIAEESRGCPPEVYLERARALTYGEGRDSPIVAEIRAGLRKGVNSGLFAKSVADVLEPGSEG